MGKNKFPKLIIREDYKNLVPRLSKEQYDALEKYIVRKRTIE